MIKFPFLDDPRDLARQAIARAVSTPLEQVAAIHIDQAEHHAAMALDHGLPLVGSSTRPSGS